MSLRIAGLNGVKWTALSSGAAVLIQLVQIAVLTRLIPPESFGLMAIAMVAIGFAQAFSDMGMSSAIIHRQDITRAQLSSLYWLNIIVGIVVFLMVFALAPVVAAIYAQPELVSVLRLVSFTFIIQPFGLQFYVLMQKELKFNVLSKIEIAVKLIGLGAVIGFALHGFDVYALVFATLLTSFLSACSFFYFSDYKPQFYFNIKDVSSFLGFGMYTIGERCVNFFGSEMDTLLIGRLMGMEVLGIYSLAKQFIMRPAQVINPIINRVVLPIMSKVQDDTQKLRSIFLQTINHLSSVNFPIYMVLACFAHVIVPILFGAKWLLAIPIIQYLSIYAALRSIGNPVGSLLLAKGRYKLGFWWNIVLVIIIPPAILVGSWWGIEGVAVALMLFSGFMLFPNWLFLVRPLCEAKVGEYYKQIMIPMLIACFAGVVSLSISLLFVNQYTGMAIGLFFGLLSIFLSYRIWNKEILYSLNSILPFSLYRN